MEQLAAVLETAADRLGLSTISLAEEIAVLLDNIRSIYNVGSILRTADGAGLRPEEDDRGGQAVLGDILGPTGERENDPCAHHSEPY